MSTSYEFSFDVNEEITKYAMYRFIWRKAGWRDVIATTVGGIGVIILMVLYPRYWFSIVAATTYFTTSLIWFGVLVVYRHRNLATVRKMIDKRVFIQFDAVGIKTVSSLGESSVKWSVIAKVWRFPRAWIFFFANDARMTLPIDALPTTVQQYVENRITEHGGVVS